jgi:hypothetical protein
MTGRTFISTRRGSQTGTRRSAHRAGGKLVVIDHRRLQGAAWAEFHTVRKRLDRLARDLHRHEGIDVPAYDSWLHRTFPVLVTALRDLHAEVAAKSRQVQAVQRTSALYGGSLKRLWREQKLRASSPEPAPEADEEADEGDETRRTEARPEDFEQAIGPAPSSEARDIYRRLVQRLHPDRGGVWTKAREHLWHEVQQAWAVADADWLARLEVGWETAHEVVGPDAPLSRLRRAIEELHAARRDTERKLKHYRSSPQWRFTRSEHYHPALQRRTEENFAHDLKFLQRQLDHLNATIASWEEDWTKAKPSPRANRHRSRRH